MFEYNFFFWGGGGQGGQGGGGWKKIHKGGNGYIGVCL